MYKTLKRLLTCILDGAIIEDNVPGLQNPDGGVSNSKYENREASPPEHYNKGLSKGSNKERVRKDEKSEDSGSSIASTQELGNFF